MATERLAPDAILASSGLTGAVTAIDEDPDTPDASWLTTGSGTATSVRVSFPAPSGNPTPGAGLQEFRVRVRKTPQSTDPSVTVDLYEGGVFRTSVVVSTVVSSTTGVVLSGTWDATGLSDPSGAGVECLVTGTTGGGKPSNQASVEVGAIEWNDTYTVVIPSQTVSPTGIAGAEAVGSPTVTPGSVTVSPSGIVSTEALGSPVVAGPITATGVASAEAFGTATVSVVTAGPQTLSPAGIATAEAFGAATVQAGPVTVSPTSVDSAETFGSLTVTSQITVGPTGIPSAQVFGTPTVAVLGPAAQTIRPTGIPATFPGMGTPTVTVNQVVSCRSIEPKEAFGSCQVRRQVFIATGPTVSEGPAARNLPFSRVGLNRGITMCVTNGVYTQDRVVPQDVQADAVYRGGYEYEVDLTTANELAAHGFTIRTEIR